MGGGGERGDGYYLESHSGLIPFLFHTGSFNIDLFYYIIIIVFLLIVIKFFIWFFPLDIDRTFPDNIHFTNKQDDLRPALYNVLVAYAKHNPRIGYCQVSKHWMCLMDNSRMTQ